MKKIYSLLVVSALSMAAAQASAAVYNITLDFNSVITSSDNSLNGGVSTGTLGTGTMDTDTGLVTSIGTGIVSTQNFFGNPAIADIILDISIDSANNSGTQTRTSCNDLQGTLNCNGPSSPPLNTPLPLAGLTGNNWVGGETTGAVLTYNISSTQANPITGGDIFNNGALTVTVGSAVSAVPVPAAAWLFGSALVGLAGIGRKRQ